MAGNPSIEDLLAPDTDEESIAISDEEFYHLLDDKEEGELSAASTIQDDFVLEEELDYEPSDNDNDLIVNVTTEDMFESEDDEDCQNTSPHQGSDLSALNILNVKTSGKNGSVRLEKNVTNHTVAKKASVAVSDESSPTVSKTYSTSSNPPPTLPSALMTRVRDRLSTPSPAMVCWHSLHKMKKVERGLDMTTSICSWHLFHASSKEKSKTLLSDRFKEIQTVGEVESEDDGGSSGGGGGGQLSDRFGYSAAITVGKVEVGKRKGEEEEELPQNMKNKILRKLTAGRRERFGEGDQRRERFGEVDQRRERFGEVDQNFFDNVKFLSDRWRM